MEEELNENELEERLYAMLHHVDETQNNLNDSQQNNIDAIQLIENGPRSTLRRYWRTGPDAIPNPYQKINTARELVPAPAAKTIPAPAAKTTQAPAVKITPAPAAKTALAPAIRSAPEEPAPKEEKSPPKPPSPVDLSIFQSPVPQNVKKTIEFLDHEEDKPVVLESSDEDEVVEVVLPPKPTITIESSDEDELCIIKAKSLTKADPKTTSDRAVSASPVPSVVSSVSDEFIRGDCIALNISSRHPDKHSFDFSLHGSDLLGQNTNTTSKKRKRKRNKEAVTSTPITTTSDKPTNVADTCFATPKSKAKNKKQRSKLFTEKSIANPDIYDSDSNLCATDVNKNRNPYMVTDKSLPSADVYESDSNQSEIVKYNNTDQSKDDYVIEAYSSDSNDNVPAEPPKSSKKSLPLPDSSAETVDLTENDNITIDYTGICDSIVIGNVTGFPETNNHREKNNSQSKRDISMYVSSKEPSILNEDLDFDNLKGKEKICKKRQYSLTTLRAEMEKFYNESWGGEEFNHKEIQKNMSRDKSLWAIDPKDRMQSFAQRKSKCGYCNRAGHRDDMCRMKPPVCYMCGTAGHFETRCPSKICVNCGSPNSMYSTRCRACCGWPLLRCAECGQRGHPASHCPDLWRRYHNTITMDTMETLEKNNQSKKPYQMYCSGCARRGHLVHSCRVTLPFSGLPLNSPFVKLYRPIYTQNNYSQNNYPQNNFPAKPVRSKSFCEDSLQRPDRNQNNKRLSKSPTVHETHLNKRRNVSLDDRENEKSPAPKTSSKEDDNAPKNFVSNKNRSLDSSTTVKTTERAPDFIPVSSSNHDNKGRPIQDNEVSDTSAVVTSARIYVTNDIIAKLKTKEGENWLKTTTDKLNVAVGPAYINSYLSITGKLADQEVFQTELREWVQANTSKPKTPNAESGNNAEQIQVQGVPKNRNNLLRYLNKALNSLKEDFGDPRALYKEVNFLQNKHEKLMKQKVISPQKLSNSRTHLNQMLKKLNIVLLGQAGLADGSTHLNELISIKQKLLSSRQKNITPSLRKEILDHYQCIFSSNARSDYNELVKKYYVPKIRANVAKKKKKRKPKKLECESPALKPSIPSQHIDDCVVNTPAPRPLMEIVTHGFECASIWANRSDNTKQLQKLMAFRQTLNSLNRMGNCPRNSRKEMLRLISRIQPCILSLHQESNMTLKKANKIKKVKEQAEKFLAKI